MKKELKRFSIWQTTKVLTLWYFVIAVIAFVIVTIVELAQGVGAMAFWNLLAPFVYAVVLLILYPIGFWIYNRVASWVGGIEFELEDK